MNRYRPYTIVALLAVVVMCGCHRDFQPDSRMCFYRDVFDISENVRDVGVREFDDGKTYIGVSIYADQFEYDYEEFCDRVVEVASDYNLNENGSYQVTIYDLNTSLQDLNSVEHAYDYTGNYFGEYSKEYD